MIESKVASMNDIVINVIHRECRLCTVPIHNRPYISTVHGTRVTLIPQCMDVELLCPAAQQVNDLEVRPPSSPVLHSSLVD